MHSKSDNIEMVNDKVDEIIEEFFENNLESMKGSGYVHLYCIKSVCIPSYCGAYFPAF